MNHVTESLIPSQPINYMHSLHEALKYHQEEIPFPYLMGVSGEAFRFFYNRFDPEAGMNTFLHNPLRATCKALGLNHDVLYDQTYQAGWERLRDNIRAGKPALLPFSDSCPFLIASDRPETVVCQNGSRYKLSTGDLHARWQPGGGFLELGPFGYYQFVIGEQEREPKPRETALGAFRCASKLMRTRRRIRECAMGLAAYEELIAHLSHLSARKKQLTEREVEKVARWNGSPLLQCLEARKSAVTYLQLVREHFADEELEHLNKAIAAYEKVVTLLRKLRTILPSVSSLSGSFKGLAEQPAPARMDLTSSLLLTWQMDLCVDEQATARKQVMKRFKPKCRSAVKVLKEIVDTETVGVNALEDVVRVSEKLKM